MKKVIYVIVCMLCMVMAACGSDSSTEKALDGGWSGYILQKDDDGETQRIDVTYIFDAETHEVTGVMSLSIPPALDEPDFRWEITGTWSASKEYIDIDWNFGKNKLSDMNGIFISDRLEWFAEQDASQLRKEFYEEMKDEGITGDRFKIVDLTSDKLILRDEEDGERLELNKTELITEIEVDEVSRI